MLEPFSPSILWFVVAAAVIAFVLSFGVGANDVANSFGTSVGAKVLTIRNAFILATIFEIAGATLIGYSVSNTVRADIADISQYADYEKELILGFTAALVGSAIWNLMATWFKMPISGTHSIVGAIVGFTIVARGVQSVRWMSIAKIVASWFVSPILSGLVSAGIFSGIKRFILRSEAPLEPALRAIPIFYGATIFVNVLSIILGGPKLLYLDIFSWWEAVLISLGIGVTTVLIVWFVVVPRKRKLLSTSSVVQLNGNKSSEQNLNGTTTAATASKEPSVTLSMEKTNKSASNGTAASEAEVSPPALINGVNIKVEDPPEVAHLFSFLQIMTACWAAFAHGGNDVSNAIGPMAAIYSIYENGITTQGAETPIWVLAYGGIGISVGLWALGRRVIETIGNDITILTPTSGFSVEIGAAMTVLLASKIGLPISTTHCKVGSVFMIGLFRSRKSTSYRMFANIAAAWLLTVPITAICSGTVMWFLRKWFDITPSFVT